MAYEVLNFTSLRHIHTGTSTVDNNSLVNKFPLLGNSNIDYTMDFPSMIPTYCCLTNY